MVIAPDVLELAVSGHRMQPMQMPARSLETVQTLPPGGATGDAAWLAAHALEPNFTLMPQWLEPLAAQLGSGAVSRDMVMGDDGRPGALVCLRKGRWRWGLPLSHLETWFGEFPISGTPLLNPSNPAGVAARLVAQLFAASQASAVLLSHVTCRHAVTSVLADGCGMVDAPVAFLDQRERAALHCNGDHEAWFNGSFSRKRRKEFRRLRSRLDEEGGVTFEVREGRFDGLDRWIKDFCALERSGWKGRAGTAIGSSDSLTGFMTASLDRLAGDNKLVCWSLLVAGKPVAMMFGVREGATCWIVKIARDEAFDKFSPGLLLVLDVTGWLFGDDEILFADSCAEPGHPMIDHIWRDRLPLCDVLIGRPGQSRAVFGALVALEQARRAARRNLKSLRNRLRKGLSR
jgi:CelD/BcsL family acetyltransferase involved in cellulose biosynthesis